MSTPDPSATPERAPVPLRLAAALTGLECLVLLGYGAAELFALSSARATMGVTTAVFFVVYAVGLAWCALQLARRASWARAPVVLAQLIQLGVAWSLRGGATAAVSAALSVVAVVVLVGIFHPASLRALTPAEDERPEG